MVAASICHWIACAEPPPSLYVFGGPTMGTTYRVKLVAKDLAADELARAKATTEDALSRINRLMSTWDSSSELSRFNRHLAGARFPASPETLAVFEVAREVSEASGGALDVTVGPLVDAWGFGAGGRVPMPPSPDALARIQPHVGQRKLEIDSAGGTLMKRHPSVTCDVSAVAKGFAVDRVARALQELGFSNLLVEVGGEVRGEGVRPDGRPWQVAIETPGPESGPGAFQRAVLLAGATMASSGDYRNYYEADGVWLSHLIDPRSGRPIAHDLAAVSVVHADGARADAWATALVVLGPDEGFAVALREGLAAYFTERTAGNGFRMRATPGMERLLSP